MSQPDESTEKHEEIRVRDRRRFDSSGNARPADEPATAVGSSSPRGEEASDPAPASAPPTSQGRAQSDLTVELEAARRRIDELARAYQAVERDREEFKQRLSRERDRMIDVERGSVALLVIEAIDELDLCLASADASALAQGVRLIRDGLLRKVEQAGIERLSLVGQPFDPNLAEAADLEVTGDATADQRVLAEVRAGYRLKDRIIRPARVRVARYVQPASA